jgi:cyanophycin synthetase
VMVLGLPGDRRDEDLIATFKATLPFVDEYVLSDERDRRGREVMEIPRLMQSHLPADKPHELAANQREAIQKGWKRVKPGDRLIIIADKVDEAIEIAGTLAISNDDDGECVYPVSVEYTKSW